MFELVKLRITREKLLRMASPRSEIHPVTGATEIQKPVLGAISALGEVDRKIEDYLNSRILMEAKLLDIDIPKSDDHDCWVATEPEKYYSARRLTQTGRARIRLMIDEEKTRRFEVRVRWVKLLIPAISALAGLAGAITGVVLALKK
jgi:hypothetical protein